MVLVPEPPCMALFVHNCTFSHRIFWNYKGTDKIDSNKTKLKMTLVIWVFLPVLFGCEPERKIVVPDHLVGIWDTEAPKYANHDLQFTKESVVFIAGGNPVAIYPIKKIDEIRGKENISYKITYLSLGKKYKLSFTYDSANGGVIVIKNRNGVEWTRKMEVSTESEA